MEEIPNGRSKTMRNENNIFTVLALILQAIDVIVGIWAAFNSHTAIIIISVLTFLILSVLLIIKLKHFVKNLIETIKKLIHNNNPQRDGEIKDDSVFISEYPSDGITIPVGKIFKKSWTVKNAGNTIWEKRTLRCVEYVNDHFFPVKPAIKIPKTLPNQIITLKVEYYVLAEGDYHSKWKMYDKNNNIIYPEKNIGLGVNILARMHIN